MNSTASTDDVRTRVTTRLTQTLGPRRLAMWFDRSARFAYDPTHQTLRIGVPSRFVADWIGRNFSDVLRQAAREELGEAVSVDLHVDAAGFEMTQPSSNGVRCAHRCEAPAPRGGAGDPPDAPRRRRRGAGTTLRHQLETFVVGSSNALAHAAACRLAEANPDHTPVGHPLFVHGGCGLGKTHLLQGVCARLIASRPEARVHYTTAEQFTNDYIAAVRDNRIDPFRRRIRGLDLLAVDDVHFLANKQATQKEFLHSFDHIELGGARVMLASDCHPKLIKTFSDALTSRCVRGLVVQINPPDAQTRLTLVETLAQRREMTLQPGVARLLAQRCEGSVREIEGMLTKLQALASLGALGRAGGPDRPIGHALAHRLFEGGVGEAAAGPPRPIRFETILSQVADRLGVQVPQILGRRRHRMVVLARSLVTYLARDLTSMSYPEIAAAMNRSNHSTAITAAKRMHKHLAENRPMMLPRPAEASSSGATQADAITSRELVDQLRGTLRRT